MKRTLLSTLMIAAMAFAFTSCGDEGISVSEAASSLCEKIDSCLTSDEFDLAFGGMNACVDMFENDAECDNGSMDHGKLEECVDAMTSKSCDDLFGMFENEAMPAACDQVCPEDDYDY